MFGGGGGRGMGGGRGGSMLKAVGRSVTRAGVTNLQETISSSSAAASANNTATNTSPTSISRSTTHKQLSSSHNNNLILSGSHFPTPVSAHNNISSWPYFGGGSSSSCDEFEWVSVDGSVGEEDNKSIDDFVLGPVPSPDEVHSAVSALTQVFDGSSYPQFVTDKFAYDVDRDVSNQISSPTSMLRRVSPAGSEADWMEPSPHLCNSRILNPYGPDRVFDAFHLLRNDPSIQRMVISLSSDKAVWNAVLNNDVVQELRDTYKTEEINTSTDQEISDETAHGSNPAMNAVEWIFQNTKAKFMEVLQKITTLMNDLFKGPDVQKTTETTDRFEERLRTSFLLSVVVLLVVVVSRVHRA